MTAAARLIAVARWDVPAVRSAVARLSDVSDGLLTCRVRLEGLGRQLGSPGCWTGPAAQHAVASIAELSVVMWGVDSALCRSSEAYRRLVTEASAAQGLAEVAVVAGVASADLDLALSAYEGLESAMNRLFPGAGPPSAAPGTAAAVAALEHADRALAAARDTGAGLSAIGVDHALAPVDFWGLLARVPAMGPFVPPEVPAGLGPDAAATWWAALSASAQDAVIRSFPAAVGPLDGLPAWARDLANRILLARALDDPHAPEGEAATARAVAARIAAAEASGRQVQLHLLDLSGDRVVLAIGNLDTAEAVAVVVPGIFNTAADDLAGLTGDALDLADAARAADSGATVAAMVWLGYRTPSNLAQAAMRARAERGGRALARALAGLTAARHAVATPAPRTTVVAHSYGTVVVDEAADEPGTLAADAVVLLGSPGMEDDAGTLEAPAVFDAASPGDVVPRLVIFGDLATWADAYGSTHLPTEKGMGHSDYFDPDRPTLAAVGEVVAGTRHPD